MHTVRYFTEALTMLGFFAAIFFAFYFYIIYRNKERMALIEKGVDVSQIYKKSDFSFTFRFPWLRLAWLSIGIGFGVAFSYFMIQLSGMRHEEMVVSFALLIFGGIGLILGNRFERKFK